MIGAPWLLPANVASTALMRLEARTVAPPSLDTVKMEERKRPSASDDPAPPAKRHQLAVNGLRPHPDADMPWKDDIEVRPCPDPRPLYRHRIRSLTTQPRLFRKTPSSARCASTSVKRPRLSLSSARSKPAPNTTTITCAQLIHGLIRLVHTAFESWGCADGC